MIPRLFSFLIIGFWLVMTGLLMRAIWFPADSRLDVVNPGAVFRLMAVRGEPSDLDIYEDRRVVGKLKISPIPRLPGDSRDVQIHIAGSLTLREGVLEARQLSLVGHFSLDHHGTPQTMNLTLAVAPEKKQRGLKGQNLKLVISQEAAEKTPVVKFWVGDLPVLDTSEMSAAEQNGTNPLAGLLLGFVGMSPTELDGLRQSAALEAAATSIDARQGDFDLEGTAHKGYILSVRKRGQTSFRICVENTGQIVSIQTPTSYHLLSADLQDAAP